MNIIKTINFTDTFFIPRFEANADKLNNLFSNQRSKAQKITLHDIIQITQIPQL